MQRLGLGLIVLFASATPAWSQAIVVEDDTPDYHRRWAFVVGIDYKDSDSLRLRHPERDAQAVMNLLQTAYGFSEDSVDLLLGADATRQVILERLEAMLSKVGKDDCFLFYFAGHGVSEEGASYLYPADVESPEGMVRRSARLDVVEIFRQKPQAKHSLYLFDSCYSGQVFRWLKLVDAYENANTVQETRADLRAVQVLASSTSTQTALDDSPFYRALMHSLKRNPRVQENRGVAANELFEMVKEQMANVAGDQRPQFAHINPDSSAATVGGNFQFTLVGELPPPLVKGLVFQTLPGSYASLPGSTLNRTWFEEMPWLTPEMRMILDGDPRNYPSSDSNHSDRVFIPAADILKEMVVDNKWEIDERTRDIVSALASVPFSQLNRTVIPDLLNKLDPPTRDPVRTGTSLHLQALLMISAAGEEVEIEKLFGRASGAYGVERNQGLRARCLADHANWLLRQKNYIQAEKKYKLAMQEVEGIAGIELFLVELHAGRGMAFRQLAKVLATQQTRNRFEARDKRRQAEGSWDEARGEYKKALALADQVNLPDQEPVRSFLHERLAWLAMDRWEVDRAVENFTHALEIVESLDADDLNGFLTAVHCRQGLAMARRLKGECGKQELSEIQREIVERTSATAASQSAFHERLYNTTERLGDCDFLRGRSGMEDALPVYRRGLSWTEQYGRFAEGERERNVVEERRLRFLCKAIIAAVLVDDHDERRELEADYRDYMEANPGCGEELSPIIRLLCELTDAFLDYAGKRSDPREDTQNTQQALDRIRNIVQRNTTANLDREPAELLWMMAGVSSEEQRRLDARILAELLPRDIAGNAPQGSIRYVREQYDRIALLQGGTYKGAAYGHFSSSPRPVCWSISVQPSPSRVRRVMRRAS